jgi:hypothetical protein
LINLDFSSDGLKSGTSILFAKSAIYYIVSFDLGFSGNYILNIEALKQAIADTKLMCKDLF